MIEWDRFAARLGVGLALVGFIIIFLGWNGAASVGNTPSQFPYLISGGIAGLALVIVGAALMVIQNAREDRAELRREVRELREAVEKNASAAPAARSSRAGSPSVGAGMVLAGPTNFHRPGCRLVDNRGELPQMSIAGAREQGLTACRVCNPGSRQKAGAKRSSRG